MLGSDLKNSARPRYNDIEHTVRVRKFVADQNMKVHGYSTGENFYPSHGNSNRGINGI